ncbi:PA0069 family radical SAM protein [bacterium]|nr:PA0069 family radical SAM protein [bacterium]
MKRGTENNPAGRFESRSYEADSDAEPGVSPRTVFIPDPSRSIISRNQSPDIGFEQSVNPYRGCEHGCIYCYARPTHEYLGFSAGLDFETKILVKEKAPELLEEALAAPRYEPSPIIFSGVTDCYQPVERRLQLTRRCIEVLARHKHPVWIITKNALVARDKDHLGELARHQAAAVMVSLTSLDAELIGKLEPRTSRPAARLAAIRELADAGVPVGINIAPVIPTLNESEIPAILKAAHEAGASFASYVLVRLPFGVKDLFADWLEQHFPDRKGKVLSHIRASRDGKLNDPSFGSRMRGVGNYADNTRQLFEVSRRRAGFDRGFPKLSSAAFEKPKKRGAQLDLF